MEFFNLCGYWLSESWARKRETIVVSSTNCYVLASHGEAVCRLPRFKIEPKKVFAVPPTPAPESIMSIFNVSGSKPSCRPAMTWMCPGRIHSVRPVAAFITRGSSG